MLCEEPSGRLASNMQTLEGYVLVCGSFADALDLASWHLDAMVAEKSAGMCADMPADTSLIVDTLDTFAVLLISVLAMDHTVGLA
jgi:hypothetical protein